VELFGQKMGKGQSAFRQGLAMLPQDPKSLFVKKTLALDLEEMTQEAEKIQKVAQLCRIEHLLEQHPMDLSGGELQRSALAKVLLTEPKLLLLDEPTKGLDSFFKLEFAKILEKLTQKGVTILMVSHDVEFCAEYAHQVGMFFDGQMLTQASPKRFFGQNSFYTTAANRMSRCVFRDAVTAQQVVELYEKNGGERL
jgi:energy-coupling factor transport system ATP-binding protein